MKHHPHDRHSAASRCLITSFPPNSAVVESYRMLRTNVMLAAREEGLHTFMVTSAGAGEGKSLTSANLSLSLAELGQRVLLLDCDLRMPSLGRMFGQPPGAISITDLFDERDQFDQQRFNDAVVPVADDLHLFRATPSPIHRSTELLESDRLDRVFDAVRDDFDTIIVDSPPAGIVTDATIIANKVDAVLFVLSHGQTRRRFVRRALREISKADTHVLGIVPNRFPAPHRRALRATDYLGGETYGIPALAPQSAGTAHAVPATKRA